MNKDLKEKAVSSGNTDLITLFNDTLQTVDPVVAANMSFPKAKNQMRRARRELYPKNVKTPEQVADFLDLRSSPVAESYYKTIKMRVSGKDERMVILYHPPLLEKVDASVTTYLFDGTFKTCPAGFYQAFNIAADINGHVCLLFTVLMTRKHGSMYDPRFATSDFETAIMNAVEKIYPDCDTTGCQFHSGHSMNKKMRGQDMYGMYRWVKNNPAANLLYKKYLSLSFLPKDNITERLHCLREEIDSTLPEGARKGFRKFHLYIKTYWIRKVRPERMSVFGKSRRTNNGLENLHSQMARTLVKHGSIFKFIIGVRKNIWAPTMIKLHEISEGINVQAPQNSKQRKREELITRLQGRYLRHEISLRRYHCEVANMYHSYESKKTTAGEAQVLVRDVEDEFNYNDPPRRPRPPATAAAAAAGSGPDLSSDDSLSETEQAADPNTANATANATADGSADGSRRSDRLEDDDYDFEISDDENLADPEEEETFNAQARAADLHMNQLVDTCPICKDEVQHPHLTQCGHTCCLACFIIGGIDVRNREPYPPCPLCRAPVKRLFKVYPCEKKPRHELMDRDFTDVTNAENDLNPAAAGEFRSLCTQLFNYEKIVFVLFG